MTVNKNQLRAITHDKGPLLIVAGAGTGKTTVLTKRVEFLVKQLHVNPYQIFLTTFTQKATNELESRLDQIMPFGYVEPWIGTFHSICERILRLEGLAIGLNPNFQIMSDTESWIFLKRHLFNFDLDYYRPLGNPTKFITEILGFFDKVTNEDVSLTDFEHVIINRQQHISSTVDELELERIIELKKAFSTYAQLKLDEKKVDFGDLLTLTLKLFRSRQDILQKYQHQFTHILIDEFQDTNISQFELIKLLAPAKDHPNLIVVGDDNQAIYKFRGASISNILQFKDEYPEAKEIILTDNYRSSQAILDASYQCIQFNNPHTLESKLGISKKLASKSSTRVDPTLHVFESQLDECNFVCNEIRQLIIQGQGSLSYKDIAILSRSNSHLDMFASTLKDAGIPYQKISNTGLYDQDEVAFLLDFLTILVDPSHSINLFKFISHPFWKFNATDLFQALRDTKNTGSSLITSLKTIDIYQNFLAMITKYQNLAVHTPVSKLLYQFIAESAYIQLFLSVENLENQLKIKNLNLFFQHLKSYESTNKKALLVEFMSDWRDWLEAGDNPGQAQIEDVDTVSLMTVHAAKGLEFTAVFMVNLVAGRFPSVNHKELIRLPDELVKETVLDGDEHLEEERRLFYVGLTRAKTHLYLTYSKNYGGKKSWKPSGFIAETGLVIQNKAGQTLNPFNQSNIINTPTFSSNTETFHISKVSFSQIDTFDACPLRYKYKYLYQIPTKDTQSLSYGNHVHQTLLYYHQQKLQGKTIKLPEIQSYFTKHFDRSGFDDPELLSLRLQKGLTALQHYLDLEPTLFGNPIFLEQQFTLPLSSGYIIGKIDRLDEMPDGTYAIFDYKTSDVKDQQHVDASDQLSIYALAAKDLFTFKVNTLGLYFFDFHKLVTTTRDDKKLERFRVSLNKKIESIQSSQFEAKPSVHNCSWCEYQNLCPFALK